MLSDTAYY